MFAMNRVNFIGLTTQFLVVSILILKTFRRHESIDTKEEQLVGVYDYIIIGSGSCGSIIAHRLAEDRRTKVLLLEAGGPAGLSTDIPGQVTTHLNFLSQYDWNFTMDRQFVGRAFLNEMIPENRGFAIGGSSTINTLIYNRGNRRDFDTWAQEYGAVGWSYAEILPYFKRWEGNRDLNIVNQSPGYHSTNGPIAITSWEDPDPLMLINRKIINTEAGIPTTDINGPNQVGTALAQAFIDEKGVRSSASNAYIDPNPFHHNLHILTKAFVTKILFKDKTAVGVLYERKGHGFRVMATKEVIVSAGVHNTAKLLMLSGIGHRKHLEKFRIPVLKDLPVGDNFANHPGIDFNFLIRPESYKLLNMPAQLNLAQLYEWLTKGSGPLASYYRGVTYFSTSNNPDKDWPNAYWENAVWLFPQNLTDFRFYRFGQRAREWEQYLQPFLGRMYLFVHPILQRVRSKGYVRLASANPHVPPRINPLYLTDELDYLDEIEMIQRVLKHYELSSISQHLIPPKPIPGCSLCPNKRYIFECESYIRCHIEQLIYTTYHGVGTCRMGDPKRKDVVVDPRLRVKGLNNLRVCDTSIMPLLPNANTNAAALMIGEKCAQLIKEK